MDEQKKSGDLAPGLAEQLDVQVKNLKDKNVPDIEILTFSGHLSFVSECLDLDSNVDHLSDSYPSAPPEPGKNYVSL